MKKAGHPVDSIEFKHDFKRMPVSLPQILQDIGLVIGITTMATLISFVFRALGFHDSNYIMTFILGVLLIAHYTHGFVYGVSASVIGVLVFNFFFTQPYYTLRSYGPEYPVTFLIMLIVALGTSTLTARVKRESQKAEVRETRIQILYRIEKNLLAVKDRQQAAEVAAKDIRELLGVSVLVCVSESNGELSLRHVDGEDVFGSNQELRACREAFESGIACGAGTQLFSGCNAYYMPISGQSGVLGVMGIPLTQAYMRADSWRMFMDTIGNQIALVLERERLYEMQQQAEMEIERERLRGNLLRAVSHDLRTPLTGIMGAASTIMDNSDLLTEDVKKCFIQGIYEDAEWLNELVGNILNMTRFQEGSIQLHREMEAVEEIVAEAISRVNKRMGGHELSVSIPEELMMISVDGKLIEQVLVNLLDNAIKHTPEHSRVGISVSRTEQKAIFEVSDNGPGISEGDLPLLFNRFYTAEAEQTRNQRGIGLGLTICKAIVEAHGGQITAANLPSGGSVFRFTLPIKE